MHLALGSQRLDLTRRPVVIGVVADAGAAAAAVADGADAVWLGPPGDVADVAEVHRQVGRPVGVDAGDAGSVDALVDAGAVAVGVAGDQAGSLEAAARRGATVVVSVGDASPVEVARRASRGGLAPAQIVLDGAAPVDPGLALAAVTTHGRGPVAWAEAAVALDRGVRVVRTADVASVRRVAAVMQRLLDARQAIETEAGP